MSEMHAPDVYCGDPNCALYHEELAIRLFIFQQVVQLSCIQIIHPHHMMQIDKTCLEWSARFSSTQSTWTLIQDTYLSNIIPPETELSIYNPVSTDWDDFSPCSPRLFGLGEPMVIRLRSFNDSDCRHIHAFIQAVHHCYRPSYPFGPVPERYQWVNTNEESDHSMENDSADSDGSDFSQ